MNFSITFLIIGLAALAAGVWYLRPILCGRVKAGIAEWAPGIPSLHEVNWIRMADNTALITMLVGIFVLIPTWFEPLRHASEVAISGIAMLLAIQVIFLRYARRSRWVRDGDMAPPKPGSET
jgi:hypothetical protein